jgi:hypothetical protein
MLTADELDLKHQLELDLAEATTMPEQTVVDEVTEELILELAKRIRKIPVRVAIADGLKMSPAGARRFWRAYLLPRGTSNEVVLATLKGK